MKYLTEGNLTASILAVIGSVASTQAFARDDMFGHYGWGWGHMIFGSVLMILFWGGLVLVIVLAVRWLGGRETGGGVAPAPKRALDILDERLARGEIDREDYEERKRLLSD